MSEDTKAAAHIARVVQACEQISTPTAEGRLDAEFRRFVEESRNTLRLIEDCHREELMHREYLSNLRSALKIPLNGAGIGGPVDAGRDQ